MKRRCRIHRAFKVALSLLNLFHNVQLARLNYSTVGAPTARHWLRELEKRFRNASANDVTDPVNVGVYDVPASRANFAASPA